MKSPDSTPAVIAGIGCLSLVATAATVAYFELLPNYDSLAAANPVSLPQDSTVLPIEQPAQMTLASVHKTIDDLQQSFYNQAQGTHVDMTCFKAHMQIIDSLQAEIARAEASMVGMTESQKAQVAAYIQINLDRIENEFEAIKGLFPAPPHGAPRHYCT